MKQKNKRLKQKVKELENELNTKFSTVRQQLQMMTYLTNLKELIRGKKIEDIGTFFSALLNRHPQRARKPFSSINFLLSANNKAADALIKKDLIKVQELFSQFGEKKIADQIQLAIDVLNKKTYPKKL